MHEDFIVNGLRRGAIARGFHKGEFYRRDFTGRPTNQASPSSDTSPESQRRIGRMRHIYKTNVRSRVRQGPENEK